MTMTTEEFKWFVGGCLWVRVLDKEDLFYNREFPVISIGFDWVTCDVLKSDGTHSFDFKQVELFRREKVCKHKKPRLYWLVSDHTYMCTKCGGLKKIKQ